MRKLFDIWCADAARVVAGRASRRGASNRSLLLEPLEGRRLLAATLLADINPGTSGSFVIGPPDRTPSAVTNGKLIFTANDGVHGSEPWVTDGTPGGTTPLLDINPGNANGNPQFFVTIGDYVYFAATEPAAGRELWRTDGTPEGTQRFVDIHPTASGNPVSLTAAPDGTVYFWALGSEFPTELWRMDGTDAGTYRVKGFTAGFAGRSIHIAGNGQLFFAMPDAANGNELWTSDGTEAGTHLVKDIRPGTASSLVSATGTPLISLAAAATSDEFYFYADAGTGSGLDLWKSDGTEAGTELVLVAEPGNPVASNIRAAGDTVFFVNTTTDFGTELWRTDGTADGTFRLSDFNSGATTAEPPPASLMAVGDLIYFRAATPATGTELYVSDGTVAGTRLVKDITGNNIGSVPVPLIATPDGNVYFRTNGGASTLWVTRGTAETTQPVPFITTGSAPNAPSLLGMLGNDVVVSASDADHGAEPWIAAANQQPVARITLGSTPSEGSRTIVYGVESSDPDGTIVAYEWDYNYDGTTFTIDDTGSAPQGPLAPDGPAARTIALRVRDDDGAEAIATLVLQIVNVAPTIDMGPDRTVGEGALVSINGQMFDPTWQFTAAAPPSGGGGGPGFTRDVVTWGWEVRDAAGALIASNGGTATAIGARTVSFVAADEGVYTVTFTVTDDDDASNTDTLTVTATNVAPAVNIGGHRLVNEGLPVAIRAVVIEPGTTDTVTYAWRVTDADGNDVATGDTPDIAFTPADDAAYTVTFSAEDNDGGADSKTIRVVAANVAPRLSISGPLSVNEGATYTLNFSADGDPGRDTISSWQIDWGDGQVETVTGNPSSHTHVYDDGPSNYVIRATASDEDGFYAANSIATGVQPAADFGDGGRLTLDFASRLMAVQPDGKIVLVSRTELSPTNSAITVRRLHAHGSLDTSFGDGGVAVVDMAPGHEGATSIAFGPGASIVLAGAISLPSQTNGSHAAVIRFTADGHLDTTFDGDGFALLDLGGFESFASVAVQRDGKIVAAGRSDGGVLIARYDSDGNLDRGFDGDGVFVTAFTSDSSTIKGEATAVAVQEDGKIIAAGSSAAANSFSKVILVRLAPEGALDATFDDDGKVTTDLPGQYDEARAIALQADGKIVVGGSTDSAFDASDFALLRYTSAGALDTSFGPNGTGVIVTDLGSNQEVITDVTVQADQKIVAGGFRGVTSLPNGTIFRYTTQGTLDGDFGDDGVIYVDTGSRTDTLNDVEVHASGDIFALTDFGDGSALYRYEPANGVAVANVAPEPTIGGIPAGAVEGDSVALTAGATDPSAADTAAGIDFAWVVTRGGETVAQGEGATIAFTTAQDGTYTVTLTANDKDGAVGTTTASFDVANAAPVVTSVAKVQAGGVRGQRLDFVAAFTDAGTLDAHTVTWDFGDGSPAVTLAGSDPASLRQSHVFTSEGAKHVTVTVSDGTDTGTASAAFTVNVVELDTTSDPAETRLMVGGTSGNDTIHFDLAPRTRNVEVHINGAFVGTFPTSVARLVVFGQGGNDTINVNGVGDRSAVLYGDSGNDTLIGNGGEDVLVGGAGDDSLVGGDGRDLLIGGAGADRLNGGDHDDVLIGGTTSNGLAQDTASLLDILHEWRRTDLSYAARVASLSGGLLSGGMVADDIATDVLSGGKQSDWFLAALDGAAPDVLSDRAVTETATDVP